jgi:hypothetical protein
MDAWESRQKAEVETVQETTRKQLGQITAHCTALDVQVFLEGASEIRLLTMVRERA